MMMSKEEIVGIKSRLAEAVEEKKSLTRQRLVLKRIPFKDRTAEQHGQMMSLIGLASDQKDAVRALQLAYAFVRGRAYWTQERRCRPGLSPENLAAEIARLLPVPTAEVQAWVEAPVDGLARAAFAAHEQVARERATAARAERTKARQSAVAA